MMRYFLPFLTALVLLSGCAMYCPQQPVPLFPWGLTGDGHAARSSSYDRTGANSDNIQIQPGETVTIADISGPGIIRHIWTTTNAFGPIGRTLIIRMYWDGSETPAVEVPFGDFFGVGNGMQADVNSWPITVGSSGRSRNCWWPMPFSDGAVITLTNEGAEPHGAFYYYVDYLALDKRPATRERFHAQYRQAYPADSPDNYLILETDGRGHYLGVVMSVEGTEPNWWGEGDDQIIADDHEPLRGTGTEDYFCDAWGMRVHSALFHGATVCEGFSDAGQRTTMYRFHILDPIPFKERIHVSIEHGTQNNRADNLSSVAFWYQVPPAAPFPPLPAVEDSLVGEERFEFIRQRAWQQAAGGAPEAEQRLEELADKAKEPENRALIEGLMAYVQGVKEPTDKTLSSLDAHLAKLKEMVEAVPEEERYIPAEVQLPTDNDNPVASPIVAAYRTLERARHDLARRVALKRGLQPGDELVVEARNAAGRVTPPPTYKETPDFTNSYAKADDTYLMGNGARFTYGDADPSWARFTPDFPRSGRYEVLVIFSYGANAGETRYEIQHTEGKATVQLQQRGRPGTEGRNNAKWHSLGTYRFEKDQDAEKGSVTLHASPGLAKPHEKFEYRAYADSVRFVFVGE